ncbi:class I SAM-dependent methyltransferase [Cognataquiflexum aquatile]|uniref:class I SAM-dependent methyltransferase n=1 Tax=Cognataquiflexum aquatile TaxID=2249427 RepID=UPI000DE8BF68|nr:class I SAM-dependent methyltransferase [Cognataquiflexum aquatile]
METDLKKWHEDEKVWWNQHGEYMNLQWKLNDNLNKLLRNDLEIDYENYLFSPKQKMLDVGCGSGWFARSFSEKGMFVTGIDVSQEQINIANNLKSKTKDDKLTFICCDLLDWDCSELESHFDVIFVSAFLHHLPMVELEEIIRKISFVLKKSGKVYLYEPLESNNKNNFLVKIIDHVNNIMIEIFLTLIPKFFKLYNKRHIQELENGYSMESPHERPLNKDELESIFMKYFDVIEIRAWHIYSLGFSMQAMGLKKAALRFYSIIISLLVVWEKALIKTFGWEAFSRPGRFILCGIKLVKK